MKVKQKKIWVLLAMLLLFLTMVSCKSSGDSPEEVAKKWVETGLNQEMDSFMRLTCSADRDTVAESGFYKTLVGGLVSYFGIDVEMSSDLSDLEFTTIEKDEHSAIVDVNGTLFVSMGKMPMEIPLENEMLYLVKEEKDWRVCSSSNMNYFAEGISEPNNIDLLIDLPINKQGFYLVSKGNLLPLNYLESTEEISIVNFPKVNEAFPVVLLRTNDFAVAELQLVHLIAGVGFSAQETDQGIVVTKTYAPAIKMGLTRGDIILAVNNVDSNGDWSKVRGLISTELNQNVELRVLRGSQTLTLTGKTDAIVGNEKIPFDYNTTDNNYLQLFPRNSLVDGLYCYGFPYWSGGVTEPWCFAVDTH
jgi:hypothetical protein